jgi:hypothetical protein
LSAVGGFQALVKQAVTKMNPHFWPKNPKPNLQNDKMNTSPFNTMSYERKAMKCENEKQSQTNPIPNQSGAEIPRVSFSEFSIRDPIYPYRRGNKPNLW